MKNGLGNPLYSRLITSMPDKIRQGKDRKVMQTNIEYWMMILIIQLSLFLFPSAMAIVEVELSYFLIFHG